MEMPKQTPQTPHPISVTTHFPTRATNREGRPVRRRGRKLVLADIEGIAALVGKRASEREACAVLGIPYSTWQHFKAKAHNSVRFEEVLQRIRGEKIKGHLENIEAHAAKDWRASEAYLEKVMPERFSKRATVEPAPAVLINVAVIREAIRRAYAGEDLPKPKAAPVKELPAPGPRIPHGQPSIE